MFTYDLLEPSTDLNEALDTLTTAFAPLYTDSWVKEKAPLKGNPPFDMNVNTFVNMWFSKAMKIVMAYEDGTPVGYLMGMVFRPLPYRATVFQVEDWYASKDRTQVIGELFHYTQNALRFIGVDELWVSHGPNEWVPPLAGGWAKTGSTITDCYKRD